MYISKLAQAEQNVRLLVIALEEQVSIYLYIVIYSENIMFGGVYGLTCLYFLCFHGINMCIAN